MPLSALALVLVSCELDQQPESSPPTQVGRVEDSIQVEVRISAYVDSERMYALEGQLSKALAVGDTDAVRKVRSAWRPRVTCTRLRVDIPQYLRAAGSAPHLAPGLDITRAAVRAITERDP
jgi:hypothetical protein